MVYTFIVQDSGNNNWQVIARILQTEGRESWGYKLNNALSQKISGTRGTVMN